MSHLTVTFADDRQQDHRSRSGSSPRPNTSNGSSRSSRPILYPIEPSTKKKTFHLPLGSPSSPNGSGSRPSSPIPPDLSDPERLPLLESSEYNRRLMTIPIIVTFFLIIVGLIVGGWALGQGAGGDRWPGGPHAAPI
ncbi:hypothetical protein DB88DRAFT_511068 [Papiliotrema laurentii]|uniref:Uncharacterized protein n=1 Tax=Papiliotrema laurentii TaxID=5418 RepID=A0AAD9FPF4_PAPLA|nr:hypothetical protein DB88DRAFT_511068 [Papiliotrema laurentii]